MEENSPIQTPEDGQIIIGSEAAVLNDNNLENKDQIESLENTHKEALNSAHQDGSSIETEKKIRSGSFQEGKQSIPEDEVLAEYEEEFEETYEEEVEEDGEIKTVVKTRIVKRKLDKSIIKEHFVEEEVEEEYEEEETDENGQTQIVLKKRLVKVKKSIPSLDKKSISESLIDVEEEFEEEVVDEEGNTTIVKKTRMIKVPRKKSSKLEKEESFEDLEEEYEEEEIDESGEPILVKKTRTVKVLKERKRVSQETITKTDKGEEIIKSKPDEDTEKEGSKKEGEEFVEDEIKDTEELLGLEEEDQVLEEEEPEGERTSMKEKKKGRKKRRSKKDKSILDEEEEIESEITKRKKKRRKRKSKEDIETKSGTSFDTLKEDEEVEEEESLGGIDEEIEEEEVEEISLTSSQMRLAEERAAITEQFEILQRLRSEQVLLKKKNFHLTNKLVQYFKKQKMDHVFSEPKEDPDLEQRYLKKLTQFYECNLENNDEKQRINSDWEAQLVINEDLNLKVKEGWEGLMTRKREVSAKLIDPRTGRTVINDKTIDDLLNRQENQIKQISDCRLLQIKLRLRIEGKKQERQMDHMGMDFNLMDYEKLSSLKEFYTDKITERDIEIGEVKQKMREMEDKLAQVKVQLRRREQEMEVEHKKAQIISSQLEKKRIDLNVVKATKHQIEKKTTKIKQQSGLLAYPSLLKDYEEKTRELRVLTAETEALRRAYKNGQKRIEKLKESIRRKTVQKYSFMGTSSCA